ncbi:MAG TPA: DNA polymerase ligase N-terminal domain-containing protein [Gemmataceae bacterium]|nr:DNA polymerase ligase N-terminal domain-containing protein [Gemmataceae bacterium]
MPRFVILEHDHPTLHWDLMLQAGETLRTWRLARAPIHPGDAIEATAIGDHRPMYLDYEGPVSGGRGKVGRWDHGTYEEEKPGIVRSEERVVIRLDGKRVQGLAILERASEDKWSFQFAQN